MRNASKNTIKRIMRRAWASFEGNTIDGTPYVPQWNVEAEYTTKRDTGYDYFFFNEIGAQIYRMSHGKICNRAPKGYKKYFKAYACHS